jgi:hypothetical protein
VNNTGAPIQFPMILATTDPEQRDPSHRSVRVASETKRLDEVEVDAEWKTLADAILAAAAAQGHSAVRIQAYLDQLRPALRRAYKSELVTLQPGQERFIRTHQRKLLPDRDGVFELRGLFPLPQFTLATGGTISVMVTVPRSTQRFSVDLLDWTRNFSPQAFGKDGLPFVGGRYVVSWLWQNDPELHVAYRYTS